MYSIIKVCINYQFGYDFNEIQWNDNVKFNPFDVKQIKIGLFIMLYLFQ